MAEKEKNTSSAAGLTLANAEAAGIADAVGTAMRRLWSRGRQEVERAATLGRVRLELRQLARDRDQFWIRLGKTAYRLVESGDIEHPALAKAMKRLDEIESRIGDLEKKYGTKAEELPGEGAASDSRR